MSKPKSTIIQASFNGLVCDFTDEGWFDATSAALHYGRRVADWLENNDTQDYLSVLSEVLKVPKEALLKSRRGRYGGTWMHPKLGVSFARWLDVRFAVWCDLQIDSIIRGTHPVFERLEARQQGKQARKTATDAQQKFTEYAKASGSENADKYWANFVRMTNAELGFPQIKGVRETLDHRQLTNLATAEYLEAQEIDLGILEALDYHQIFQAAKHRVKELAQVLKHPVAKG